MVGDRVIRLGDRLYSYFMDDDVIVEYADRDM